MIGNISSVDLKVSDFLSDFDFVYACHIIMSPFYLMSNVVSTKSALPVKSKVSPGAILDKFNSASLKEAPAVWLGPGFSSSAATLFAKASKLLDRALNSSMLIVLYTFQALASSVKSSGI